MASPEAVDRLADAAFGTFGRVHVVFNNAGVAATAATLRLRAWEGTLADWDWTMSINLMGVVHGVRAFVPRMLEGGDEGHIVNTASIAGLATAANPYNVSKHGVVCLTEGIYRDLREMGARLSASVVCPGLINTNILDAERNRPADQGERTDVASLRTEVQQFTDRVRRRPSAAGTRPTSSPTTCSTASATTASTSSRPSPRSSTWSMSGSPGSWSAATPTPGDARPPGVRAVPAGQDVPCGHWGRHEVQGAGMTAGNGTNGANGSGGQLDVDVVVVGAGVAGLYMLQRLRGVGLSATVLETGDDVGGTWYWNRYPGARCDIPTTDYTYSWDPELENDWTWSEKYATQPEILQYLQHVADRYDLRRDIRFSTGVKAAVWDDAASTWTITTSSGDSIRCRWYVMATGCLSVPKEVDIEGTDRFQGEVYFTSRWPHEGVDLTGKRVGVIGTGSSGIQSIPIIAQQAAEMVVFQRTPNFSIPARNGAAGGRAPGPDRRRSRGVPRGRQVVARRCAARVPGRHGGVGAARRAAAPARGRLPER